MNFPPFWARGESGGFMVWRWSSQSQAEAQTLANQAAQQLAQRFERGDFPPKQGGYYPNRPFREQILQEIKDASGNLAAIITRNSYGCQVLNTSGVMFVDIDLPEPKPAGFFQKLFGKPNVVPPAASESSAMARIESWTCNHSDWGWRIYRTRAGLRLLATHGLVAANSSVVSEVFEALGADPLYRKLCVSQKCFRARLTPKPWRCGITRKPERWPWLDEKQEKRFQKWETLYQSYAFNWATCEWLRNIGQPAVHPAVQNVVELHDQTTRAASKLKLA